MENILTSCVDRLKVFHEAISTASPPIRIQLCIVHMVRNSMRYVSWKDHKTVTAGPKRFYQSVTEVEALLALDGFAAR